MLKVLFSTALLLLMTAAQNVLEDSPPVLPSTKPVLKTTKKPKGTLAWNIAEAINILTNPANMQFDPKPRQCGKNK